MEHSAPVYSLLGNALLFAGTDWRTIRKRRTSAHLTLHVVAFWIIVSVVASATLVHNEHGEERCPKGISVRGVPQNSNVLKTLKAES